MALKGTITLLAVKEYWYKTSKAKNALGKNRRSSPLIQAAKGLFSQTYKGGLRHKKTRI
jgi:hypothetical protein